MVNDYERWDSVGFCKKRFKSRRGCGFQTQGLDSVDDNERWDSVGFCKNACMHVWGHVKLGCMEY